MVVRRRNNKLIIKEITMSKGSTSRPYSVDNNKFSSNWDSIFNSHKSVKDVTNIHQNSIGESTMHSIEELRNKYYSTKETL